AIVDEGGRRGGVCDGGGVHPRPGASWRQTTGAASAAAPIDPAGALSARIVGRAQRFLVTPGLRVAHPAWPYPVAEGRNVVLLDLFRILPSLASFYRKQEVQLSGVVRDMLCDERDDFEQRRRISPMHPVG